MPKVTPETAVIRACLDWWKLHPTIGVAFRVNNTGTWSQEKLIYLKPHNLTPGFSDLVVVMPQGKVVFLECKSAVGRQSEDQIAFQKVVESYGAKYHVVRSVDDLERLFIGTVHSRI